MEDLGNKDISESLIDSHCHLSFLEEDEVQKIYSNAIAQFTATPCWVMGGYQPSEWESQVHLKNLFPSAIKTCYGLHPWYVKSDEFDLSRDMEALKIWVAQADFIGEVGLDFFGDEAHLKKELQTHVFEMQLELSHGQPFVFHIVQGHGQALEILKDYSVNGFVHSFSGSIEVAEQYLDQGLLLSFGPNILNPNYKKARAVVSEIPLESLLIESDTPSHPLDESDPLQNLHKVYQEVSRIRGLSVLELRQLVNKNFQRLTGGRNGSKGSQS